MYRVLLVLAALLGVAFSDVIVTSGGHQTTYASLQARFGGDISKNGLVGQLYVATPSIYGCEPLDPPASNTTSTIVLISRGPEGHSSCEFGVKVKNAQVAGYTAAIVFNDEGDDLLSMYSDDDSITIPAVFITQSAGEALTNMKGVLVQLTADPIPQWPSFLVTFIVIIASAILMFTVFMFYRQRTQVHHAEINVARLTTVQIAHLPTRKVQAEEEESCCICLANYGVGDVVMALPCKHEFHKECIEPWLTRRNRTCPLCKRDTLPNESTPLLGPSPPAAAASGTASGTSLSINAEGATTTDV